MLMIIIKFPNGCIGGTRNEIHSNNSQKNVANSNQVGEKSLRKSHKTCDNIRNPETDDHNEIQDPIKPTELI